jgi:hypothetical protein
VNIVLVRRLKSVRETASFRLVRYHLQPLTILLAATLVMFRTWIAASYPGGTDSAFLYSGIAFYRVHGLQLFTVWLPTPFGQVSQYSIYWFLTMLTAILGSTFFTYKAAALSIALISAFGMYAVSWSWSRSRLGALAAAVFYSFSPLSVSQWLSGHFDVQISMALGPLVIWSIDRVLTTGSIRAAIGLGLGGSALLLLTSGQAAYWLPVAVVFIIGRFIIGWRDAGMILKRAALGAGVTMMVFALTSAVQLVPWLLGASAAFAGGATTLAIAALSEHVKYSLPFAQGLVGVPREAWLPPGSTLSVVPFSSLFFVVPQIIIIIAASLCVLGRKCGLGLIFLILAVGAWLIAAGPLGPVGHFYIYLWQHLSYFRELREPNRWLMVSAFSVASMLALSIASIVPLSFAPARKAARAILQRTSILRARLGPRRLNRDQKPNWQSARRLSYSALLLIAAAVLLVLNCASILAKGLPTISPPANYIRAYSALAQTTGDWRALTVPFGQGWMAGPAYGDYEGIAADLGYTSTLYDGRSTVGDGGWDPQAAQFVNFLGAVAAQGADHDLAGLLGAADIRYVVIDPESAVAVPSGQASFFESQRGLQRLPTVSGMTVLEDPFARSQIAQPTSACVIAGGYQVLEDLSEQPSFSFTSTAVYFADQVVDSAGWSALSRLISLSHCLIMGPGSAAELTVLRYAVASVQAASIAPSLWPSQPVNPLLDSQAEPANSVTLPPGGQLIWHAAVPRSGSYRIWVMLMRDASATPVPVTVNGRQAGSVMPTTPATVGYQWLPASSVYLKAGPVRVALTGPNRGAQAEVAELALVPNVDSGSTLSGISSSSVVLDEDSLDANIYDNPSVEWSHPITTSPWRAVSGVRIAHGQRDSATLALTGATRPQFTMAGASLPPVINPAEPMAFEFQGAGNGADFQLNFYFQHQVEESFSFQDLTSKPQLLYFTLQQGAPATLLNFRSTNPYVGVNRTVPNWNQLTRVTLSTNSLVAPGKVIKIAGPFPVRFAHTMPYFVGHLPTTAGPSATAASLPAGMISTSVPLHNVRSGILDFSQSFDPRWTLLGAQADIHTVALGFENSYVIEKPVQNAALSYSLAAVGKSTTIISLIAWFIGLLALIAWPWRQARTWICGLITAGRPAARKTRLSRAQAPDQTRVLPGNEVEV